MCAQSRFYLRDCTRMRGQQNMKLCYSVQMGRLKNQSSLNLTLATELLKGGDYRGHKPRNSRRSLKCKMHQKCQSGRSTFPVHTGSHPSVRMLPCSSSLQNFGQVFLVTFLKSDRSVGQNWYGNSGFSC